MSDNFKSKLEAAFLAGRYDAQAEQGQAVPEGVENLLRMVLSDADCTDLARLSKTLFQGPAMAGRLLAANEFALAGVAPRNGLHHGRNGG